MAGDEHDNHTVALTREVKAALAAEAKALISQQGEPVTDAPAPDADATEPISAERKADLQSKAHQLIADEQVAADAAAVERAAKEQAEHAAAARDAPLDRLRTKVAFTSSQVAPVGDDLLPFEAEAAEGFDDMANTEALGKMEDKPPDADALSSPAPASAPTPSATQFDIDVATRLKQQAAAAEASAKAAATAPSPAPPSPAPPSPTPPSPAPPSPAPQSPAPQSPAQPEAAEHELEVPPTTGLEGVPSTRHAEAFMPKTAVVNMEAELSDGTGMLKVMAAVAVVVVLIGVVFFLLR